MKRGIKKRRGKGKYKEGSASPTKEG